MATEIDYAAVIYDEHIRSRGGPGDLVPTSVHHFLMARFDMDGPTARKVRDRSVRELKARGLIERVNTRGPYVRILQ
jgi:hypothetical protein